MRVEEGKLAYSYPGSANASRGGWTGLILISIYIILPFPQKQPDNLHPRRLMPEARSIAARNPSLQARSEPSLAQVVTQKHALQVGGQVANPPAGGMEDGVQDSGAVGTMLGSPRFLAPNGPCAKGFSTSCRRCRAHPSLSESGTRQSWWPAYSRRQNPRAPSTRTPGPA